MEKTIIQANMARRAERKRLEDMVILTWYRGVVNGTIKLMNKRFIRFQYGNKKLAADEKIAFVVFSLPAVRTCPGATVECMKNCYARRDERFMVTRDGMFHSSEYVLLPAADMGHGHMWACVADNVLQ